MRTAHRRGIGLVVILAVTAVSVEREVNIAIDAPLVAEHQVIVHPASPLVVARLSSDYVASDAGCASSLSAAGLERFFADRVGPVVGHDSPRIIDLGVGRYLWLLQDTFTDYSGNAASMVGSQYANSTAMVQDGSCFTVLERGTPDHAASFEPGTGDSFDRFFWPAGGSVTGDVLSLFWIEIIRDPALIDPIDGANVHPQRTWLATYDVHTLQRLTFVPAPDESVSPIYGFDVVDDGAFSYLFGNTFAENLALEGGFASGPHSATSMWLARVPRGRLDMHPQYRTADGWSSRRADAVPISTRYWTENAMHPVHIGGRWLAVTKVDGFLGRDLVVDIAAEPWGPWTTITTAPATARGDPGDMVTYAPLPLPWLDPNGGLIVGLSQIDVAWQNHNGGDPARYRPRYLSLDLTAATTAMDALVRPDER